MELKRSFLVFFFLFSVGINAVNQEAILSKKPEKKLSDYEFFKDAVAQIPMENVYPYVLHSALFSDYADKHRFVYVPEGKKAKFVPTQVYDFPVGSALVKTFSYPQALNGNRMFAPNEPYHAHHGMQLLLLRMQARHRAESQDHQLIFETRYSCMAFHLSANHPLCFLPKEAS